MTQQQYEIGTIVVILSGSEYTAQLARIGEMVNQIGSDEPMWIITPLNKNCMLGGRTAEQMRPATQQEIEAGHVIEKYCQMCGSIPPQPGLIFCERCYLAYEAIHAFLREMEGYLTPQVSEAIMKAPFQFHWRLGVPYQPKESTNERKDG